MRRAFGLLTATALALGALAVPASAAEFGFEDLGFGFRDSLDGPAMEAGSHPFALTTTIRMNRETDPEIGDIPVDQVRDLRVDLPPGLVGTPKSTPRCSGPDFVDVDHALKLPACSNESAVGVAALEIGELQPEFLGVPVYNLVPSPGEAAKLGFIALGVPVTIDLRVNESFPYNIVAQLEDIAQPIRFYGAIMSVWGNPASSVHDPFRGNCVDAVAPSPDFAIVSKGNCPVDMPEIPFLTSPRSCKGPLTARFEAASWQDSNVTVTGQAQTDSGGQSPAPVGFTDCAALGFGPSITTQPTNRSAEGPTGLDVEVKVKNDGLTDPKVKAQADIAKAEVTLPEGVTINPSQAEGLGVCSEADVARETATSEPGDGCPQASKIGTVEVETPLLQDEVLQGSLFVAKPYENPVGSLIAIYMVIKNRELGISLKLPGKVAPDPRTGQLISTFDNLPELPFSRFKLHFREGGRSPLITPPTCGKYTTKAVFTPSANPTATFTTTSSFSITTGVNGGPCAAPGAQPFRPGFTAGAVNNNAGSFSPFNLRLTREDGEQDITRFSSVLPPGVVGKLAGVTQCPQAAVEAAKGRTGLAELAAPSCPQSSAIGRTIAGAGVGSQLTYVPGRLYLGGPYKGDPLSVVAIVPAVAGPFDVGTVVVQEALNLNPVTSEVEVDGAASDPIPHILAGIPLKLRDLRIHVDRPNFTLNPTNCDPLAVRGFLWGGGSDAFSTADDAPVPLSDRFQAANCANLKFKPALSLELKGKTRRGAFPALTATFRPRIGDANASRLSVTFPHSAFLEQGHIRTICTRVQFAARQCPPGSVYGTARAFSPLLDQPLEGPVYLRSSDNPLPDLVLALRGIVDFNTIIRIDSVDERLRSTVDFVPDVPLTKVVLKMQGGSKGLITNSENLCRGKHRAKVRLTGQNGKRFNTTPVVQSSCKGKRSAKRRAARRD